MQPHNIYHVGGRETKRKTTQYTPKEDTNTVLKELEPQRIQHGN